MLLTRVTGRGVCFERLCVRLDAESAGPLYGKGAGECWCLGLLRKPAWGALEIGGLM